MRYNHCSLLLVTAGLVGCATPCDQPEEVDSYVGYGDLRELPAEVPVGPDGVVRFSIGFQGFRAPSMAARLGMVKDDGQHELADSEVFLGWMEVGDLWTCNRETRWWEALDLPVVLDGWGATGPVDALVFVTGSVTDTMYNRDQGNGIGIWESMTPTTLVPADTTTLDGTR